MATITRKPDSLAFLYKAHPGSNTDIEVIKGDDIVLFNGIRYLWSFTDKVIYWNSNYASGNVSDEAINKVVQFLDDNQLNDVAVQVNDYSPGWYMIRVFTNPKTSLLSKLIFGPPAVLANILGLEKIFGADNYDVMSNSIYLSSNDVDIGLLSAARAKDYNLNSNPVLYSIMPTLVNMVIPFGGVLQFLQMQDTALTYAKEWAIESTTLQEAARTYKVVNPLAYIPIARYAINMVGAFFIGYILASCLWQNHQNAAEDVVNCASFESLKVSNYKLLATVFATLIIHSIASHISSSMKVAAQNKKIEEELGKKGKISFNPALSKQ